jgi:hypothetical protein
MLTTTSRCLRTTWCVVPATCPLGQPATDARTRIAPPTSLPSWSCGFDPVTRSTMKALGAAATAPRTSAPPEKQRRESRSVPDWGTDPDPITVRIGHHELP